MNRNRGSWLIVSGVALLTSAAAMAEDHPLTPPPPPMPVPIDAQLSSVIALLAQHLAQAEIKIDQLQAALDALKTSSTAK